MTGAWSATAEATSRTRTSRKGLGKAWRSLGRSRRKGPGRSSRRCLRFAGGGFEAANPGSLLDVLEEAENELRATPSACTISPYRRRRSPSSLRAIGQHGLADRSRVVYEKPFGTSLARSSSWTRSLTRVQGEARLPDRPFLGKEATQAIHMARFGNGLFRARGTATTSKACRSTSPRRSTWMRAAFYDSTGAILDMLVTHLFQLAAEVAMETPRSLAPEPIGVAREAVIGCFRPLARREVVVGQYQGYRRIKGVPAGSRTETFVAARLWVDNDRWEGVPFLLRTGKCVAESHQRVSIRFRRPAKTLPDLPCDCNTLSFELSGDGEIALSLVTKKPGPTMEAAVGSAVLPLGTAFGSAALPAYSRLIHDVLVGDRSLFTPPGTGCATSGRWREACSTTSPNQSRTAVGRGALRKPTPWPARAAGYSASRPTFPRKNSAFCQSRWRVGPESRTMTLATTPRPTAPPSAPPGGVPSASGEGPGPGGPAGRRPCR